MKKRFPGRRIMKKSGSLEGVLLATVVLLLFVHLPALFPGGLAVQDCPARATYHLDAPGAVYEGDTTALEYLI